MDMLELDVHLTKDKKVSGNCRVAGMIVFVASEARTGSEIYVSSCFDVGS